MPGDVLRERRVEREVQARLRRLERSIGNDLERLRIDTGVSKAAVAREAGVDRTFYGRIEAGSAHASLESLVAVAIAMGADEGVLLKDVAFEDSDTYATAYILAEAVKKIGAFDLVLCGRQAADWDVGQVGLGVAELLGIPSVAIAQKLEVTDGKATVERIVEGGYDVMEVGLPALITVSNEINKPRYPTLRSATITAVPHSSLIRRRTWMRLRWRMSRRRSSDGCVRCRG